MLRCKLSLCTGRRAEGKPVLKVREAETCFILLHVLDHFPETFENEMLGYCKDI